MPHRELGRGELGIDVVAIPSPMAASAAAEGVADGSRAVVGCWGARARGFDGLLAFGVEDDEAAGAVAGGSSRQAGGAEGKVEQAALAGVHWREGVGASRGAYLFDGSFGDHLQLAVAEELEVFGVEGDAVVLLGFEAEELGGEVLNGVEEFGVAGKEERGIGAGEFDGELGRWLRLGLCLRWILGLAGGGEDLELQLQAAGGEQGLEEFFNLFDLLLGVTWVVD